MTTFLTTIVFFFDVILIWILYGLLKNRIMGYPDRMAVLIIAIIVPIVFCFIALPTYVPKGKYVIHTTVTSDNGSEYDLDVNIFGFEESGAVDIINWPNGGYSKDTTETYVVYGKEVEIWDQNDNKYYVVMKKPSVSLKERYKGIPISDKIVWFVCEGLAIVCFCLSLFNESRQE